MLGKQLPRTLLVLCLAVGYATAQTCYFPNGDEAADDIPCSTDEHTNCCGKAGICLSNGYCLNALSQPYTTSRGTCTDQNWGSNCTQRCIGTLDNPDGGVSVINLSFINGTATYCCGTPIVDGDSIVCPNGEEAFTMETGSMILGRAALANVTSTEEDSSTVSSSPTATAASSSATAEATESASAAAATATATGSSSHGTSATAVGAGVGVPLGVIALSAIAWALWERSKRKKEVAAAVAAAMQMPPQELGTAMPTEPKAPPYNYHQVNNYGQPQWQNHSPPAELPNAGYPSEMDTSNIRQ